MPRFITVHVQCDWGDCDTVGIEGEETVAPMTIALNGGVPKEFLLCKPHRDDVERMVLPLLQAGVKVDKPKRSKTKSQTSSPSPDGNGSDETVGTIKCLVKDCGRDDIKNRAGMAQHVQRSHGFDSLAEYEERFGPLIT